MPRGLAYRTIGRGLRSGHPRPARNEPAGVVMIDRAVRRLAVALVTAVTLAMVISVAVAQAEPMPNGIPGTWQLKVNEEFTGASLNTALWTPGWQSDASISGPMSNECVSPKNVSQPGNGYLYLVVRKEHATCGSTTVEDTGGLIESNPSDGQPGHSGFAYTYGVVEWEAYVPGVSPTGRGCPKGGCLPDWPALWSLSSTNADEIDTMEGVETLGQACYHIHPPTNGPGACLSGSYASAWHTFAAKWEPGYVQFFYDGAQIGQLSSEVLNGTSQYLIADMVPPGCCGQPLVVPDEMVVNYVRVWQHPSPPTVTTNAASGEQQEQVSLNGKVNPHDATTAYHFEYGTSSNYGKSTPPGEIGSGVEGEDAVSSTIIDLLPGTTYHYRLVATNSYNETSYGAERVVTTVPRTRPSVVRATNNEQWAYYIGTTGNLWGRFFNSSAGEWATFNAGSGEAAAPGTSPAVVRESNNEQWVYYVGVGGNIWGRFFNNTNGKWETFNAGSGQAAAPGTSPAVVRESNNEQWVFYTGANGNIWGRFFNNTNGKWETFNAGSGESW